MSAPSKRPVSDVDGGLDGPDAAYKRAWISIDVEDDIVSPDSEEERAPATQPATPALRVKNAVACVSVPPRVYPVVVPASAFCCLSKDKAQLSDTQKWAVGICTTSVRDMFEYVTTRLREKAPVFAYPSAKSKTLLFLPSPISHPSHTRSELEACYRRDVEKLRAHLEGVVSGFVFFCFASVCFASVCSASVCFHVLVACVVIVFSLHIYLQIEEKEDLKKEVEALKQMASTGGSEPAKVSWFCC